MTAQGGLPATRAKTAWRRVIKTLGLIVAVAAFLASVATIVSTVLDVQSASKQGAGSDAPSTAESSSSAHASGPVADAPSGGVSCSDADVAEAPCSSPGSGVIEPNTNCAVESIRSAWGYDSLLALAVATVPLDGGCLVRPSDVSTAAGATGNDVLEAREGSIPAALIECARRDGTPSVACNTSHELEFVGDWTAQTSKDAELCRSSVVAYTANALEARSPLRSVVVPRSDGFMRCAVGASGMTLTGSVRGIGGGSLPTS